ncbi:hypothetical protein H7K45_24965 [Mycobacterium yunnanensis]|uniref:Uncharacterized protein n=1 Tax=Mycobacterium yunnanensis TaxID=368477 RepID=A0A9X2Z7N6_9MYCO|nr:hypothetical protein [Mycobacterium yunnanensis]MCV7423811.1 hypothetical protein [Mycobacterium yunnanensis]
MAKKYRGIVLMSPLAREYADWWSVWYDLLSARQALHDRNFIPNKPSNMYGRRAMWDGAVVAYCRGFKPGRQSALLGPLLNSLTPLQRARHDEALHWRDKHIAHRVDKKLEHVAVTAMVDADGQVVEVQGSVTTTMMPPESAILEFAKVVDLLKDLVWEKRLVPLEADLKQEYEIHGVVPPTG